MSVYGAYLEDYHYIKVIIPIDVSFKDLYLVSGEMVEKLNIYKSDTFDKERSLYTSVLGYIALNKDYYVVINEDLKYHLSLGKITKTKRFDQENYVTEPLGVFFTSKETIFKVWSPVAKEIYLVLDNQKYKMEYTKKGVYVVKIKGNMEKKTYHYSVRVNETFIDTLDPYSKAYTPNFKDSIVVNLNNTYQPKYDYRKVEDFNYVDNVILEFSIRDLTSFYNLGTFKDATLSVEKDYGLGYIKEIGYTHLQVLPVFGFGGVDEITKTSYNWGYNPVLYQSISNYLSNTTDPYDGINSFKEFVDTCHSLNLGVNMDVVFNHVYDVKTFSMGILVPGYIYLTDEQGFLTSSSGCGNDLNTKKLMVRRLIIDTLKYFQEEFKIDGFRFDLMNFIDVETLNTSYQALKRVNNQTFVYGEGWSMPTLLNKEEQGKSENFFLLPTFAFFNDYFRNFLKSSYDLKRLGFSMGGTYSKDDIYTALTGFCVKEERWSSPTFSINYAECHDNMTLYDVLKQQKGNLSEKEIIDYTILALGVIALSEGIPFYHLGMEFCMSKKGVDNSYNLGDSYNMVDWSRKEKYQEIIDTLKNFLNLRKKYDFFRLRSHEEIEKKVSMDKSMASVAIRYLSNDENTYLVVYKNDYLEETRYFAPETKIIFDGRKELREKIDMYKFTRPGIYMFKK